jgi:hypothetical protein
MSTPINDSLHDRGRTTRRAREPEAGMQYLGPDRPKPLRVSPRTSAREKGSCSLRTLFIVAGIIGVAFHLKQSSADLFLSEAEVRDARQSGPCALTASSSPQQEEIVIEKSKVLSFPKNRLGELKQFTYLNFEKHMMSAPGKEHYTLLEYMTSTYGDCRHVVDIGTLYVASSLALGAHEAPVWTFDTPRSTERNLAFRGESEKVWKGKVEAAKVDIKFHNLDLLKVSDHEFSKYMSTWLIMLDTHNLPYSQPFEREWMNRLLQMGDFSGLVLLDDIKLNAEMEKWWKELQDNATERGYKTYDLTSVGHFSGTGLLDFSGKVKIVE